MTTKTNTVRIDIDVNPDFPHPINMDVMREIAAEAIDWRLFVYDPDADDDDDGVLDEMYQSIYGKLAEQSDAIAMACHCEMPILNADNIDAMDFIWVVSFETDYVGTVSTYTDAVMISYVITEIDLGM